MKNRKQKIEFLVNLQKGITSISDLLPPVWVVKMDLGDRIEHYSNGKIDREEYEKRSTNCKKQFNITLNL